MTSDQLPTDKLVDIHGVSSDRLSTDNLLVDTNGVSSDHLPTDNLLVDTHGVSSDQLPNDKLVDTHGVSSDQLPADNLMVDTAMVCPLPIPPLTNRKRKLDLVQRLLIFHVKRSVTFWRSLT